ncbi:molybdopterin-binding protein [Roseiflexus castenholzii]|uniref:Molybdopterin binding domain n=1 Tax=Roseiflexus castenholzii (strain DSM 13941 / HLO8) TaxID=383372 RepID=A7NH38_ROSCS|nr:molybdopterin-binding protein [Roseiflexus castenholzii]ABU56785.1 molybdopterin binding domain [Roseiflexus castenholzii DSM 13941]
MFLTTLPVDQAVGHILRHNVADAAGRKTLPKGRRITDDDVARLRALGVAAVRVAVLEPGDVHEDEAAQRLADAVRRSGVVPTDAMHSRVNLLAEADGVVEVDIDALQAINEIDGLTIATLPNHALVRERKRVATIKIIPFALPERSIQQAERIGAESGGVVGVRRLLQRRVGVLLVVGPEARERITRLVLPAIEGRVTELGSTIDMVRYAALDEGEVAEGIAALRAAGSDLLIIAGETSIMDRDDVTPQGIRMAGGRIEHYGAPVEPGNLLLLAYLDDGTKQGVPILGAPGCVRSRATNIVDLLLPRLLAGERVTRRAIIELGHGGLLG